MKTLFLSLALSIVHAVQVIPIPRTPESSTILLKVAIPQKNQVVQSPAWIQFRIDGFALGAASQFERARETVTSHMGQTIHVVIDNEPYFPINEPAIDPFDDSTYFYDTSYKFEIPYRLKEGLHTIRMFPARSFGESLKGDGTFVAIPFYVGEKKGSIDLSKPYLTYNEPSSLMPWVSTKPVLLDFLVTNVELSKNGYKVRLTIDGNTKQNLTSLQPYYIFGLKRGSHTIRLELIDKSGKKVNGPFNDVKETIQVF